MKSRAKRGLLPGAWLARHPLGGPRGWFGIRIVTGMLIHGIVRAR